MEIKFHGHACFELSGGDVTILVDPFLKPNNPAAVATAEEVEPTHIAISHGHADHLADAVAMRERRARLGFIEVPRRVDERLGLLLPDAHHLRRLLFQRHSV